MTIWKNNNKRENIFFWNLWILPLFDEISFVLIDQPEKPYFSFF